MDNVRFYLLMTFAWSFTTCINTINAFVYYRSHDNMLGLYPILVAINLLLVFMLGFQAFMAFLQTTKIKIYVYEHGVYQRVVGPKGLIDSVNGYWGHIVIGDMFEINSGIFFSDGNEMTNRVVNGYDISNMDLRPIGKSDERELGLDNQ